MRHVLQRECLGEALSQQLIFLVAPWLVVILLHFFFFAACGLPGKCRDRPMERADDIGMVEEVVVCKPLPSTKIKARR